ncbi:DUF3139 domain-containing protein [Halobacteriovorax sp. HLS]|uniref:DUF3139 domain-containing protein n=1 Tax=Halobacteriovorax sp. HLS TaxID=2234000 RepID=UPI000FD781C3|nr:DUF3139 domain-containing protein [Halobacteriovorax sp. HLS]
MIFRIILLSILLIGVSCSHNVEKKQRHYSDQTNKSFEEIERDNAINRYKQLRWENWNKQKKSKIKTIKPKKYSHQKRTKKKAIIKVDPKEQMIEVDQNLKFYCMENRKDNRFKDSGSCSTHTNKILQQCEIKFSWEDRNLLKCVKSKLR